MQEVVRIGSQLKRASEGVAWHGPSLQELLAGVSAEQAAARPFPGAHSIWEIVLHIAAWQSFVRRAVEGEAMPSNLPMEENWPQVKDESEAAWQSAVVSLRSGNKQLRDAVRNLKDEDLERIVDGREYSVYFMLHGVIQHSLYHAGQIALLKKALGQL
ncbi:MAG: DinB family protein [Pyrinomonadaceae bacterium]|nr:DinB family protein [Pyrinomonadaceae bacterium]